MILYKFACARSRRVGRYVYVKMMCVQAYVKMYQGDELPEPKSMLQANQFHVFSSDVCLRSTYAQTIVKIERIRTVVKVKRSVPERSSALAPLTFLEWRFGTCMFAEVS